MVKARKRLTVADLFCGAGGTSTGLTQFCESIGVKLDLVAVNHWERAVETHAVNHPKAHHYCQDLTRLKPAEAVPGGKLNLLVASPECTHHSNARGGKPKNDQSRASAWVILEWVNALDVDRVLIENVPEFVSWGPLGSDGKPLKSKRGETFNAFVRALEASGYRVEYRVLNSANYGAATARRRLFVQAVKGRQKICWPAHTHERDPDGQGLFGHLPKWRAAREIIDWNLVGASIFTRKRPLSENTMKRIEAGIRKFGGENAEPFIVAMNYLKSRDHDGRYSFDLNNPLPTITGQGNRFAFITQHGHPNDGHDRRCHSSDLPLGTIVAGGNAFGLVQPFMLQLTHGGRVHDTENPIPTITTAKRGEIGLVEPFILPHRQFEQMDVDSIDQPMRTITATNGSCNALVEPSIVPYYGTSGPASVSEPLATVTTKDRFGLIEPQANPLGDKIGIDIRFRMLQPHELAAAMGFPAGYKITGNREDQVKQIGNAVEVNQARALASAVIGGAA